MHPEGNYPVVSLVEFGVSELFGYPVLGFLLKVIGKEDLSVFFDTFKFFQIRPGAHYVLHFGG